MGFIFPNSGVSAGQFQSARSGVTARIGEANAAGGINGRQVVLEWRDDESDAPGNLKAAEELVEREDVFGVIEVSNASVGSAQYLNEQGVPVAGNALEAFWGEYPNMFSYTNRLTGDGSISTWGLFAQQHGGTRAVVLQLDLAEASRSFGQKMAASLQAAGIEVVGTLDAADGAGIDRLARQIKDLNVNVITGAVPGPTFADVQAAAAAAGVRFNVALAPTGYEQATLDEYGAKIAGTYYFATYRPFEEDTPAHEAYRDAIAIHSPELEQPDQAISLTSYINTDLFLHGLEVAGACPTREGFVQNLRQVRDYPGKGLLPNPVNLANVGLPNLCYTFVRANANGTAFEVVEDAAPLCGEAIPAPANSVGPVPAS